MGESSGQMWVGIAILCVIAVLMLWGAIRIIAGLRSLRQSEKAFLEDMRSRTGKKSGKTNR